MFARHFQNDMLEGVTYLSGIYNTGRFNDGTRADGEGTTVQDSCMAATEIPWASFTPTSCLKLTPLPKSPEQQFLMILCQHGFLVSSRQV